MTIGNTGPIGINTLKGEFAASANGISSYYRNGPIVPGDIPGTTGPGNPRPGNTSPGNPRPGSSNPCRGNGPTVPGSSSITMSKVGQGNTGSIGFGTQSFSSGGPSWSKQMNCTANKCSNSGFSAPCNGGNVHFSVPASVGASQTKPAQVRYEFTPGGYSPPGTNPPTTNPPTTNSPISINQSVPTSGTIGLSNFYGARKA